MCTIRKMEKEDLKQVKKIWYDRSIEVHRFVDSDPKKYWRDKIETCEFSDFENSQGEIETYVYADKTMRGFIKIKHCQHSIYIYELFTKESKKGFGSKLLEEVKKEHPGKTLILNVYIHNLQAVNWYLRKNFVIDKVRQDGGGDLAIKNFNCFKYRMMYSESLPQ